MGQTKKWYQDQLESPDYSGYDMMRCKFHLEDEIASESADCSLQSCYRMGFALWTITKQSIVQSYDEWMHLSVDADLENHFKPKFGLRKEYQQIQQNYDALKSKKIEIAKLKVIENPGQ